MTEAYAVIGMQFGSEAKGSLCGYLARIESPDVCMANWSPNAGHTYREGGYKLVRRCIPIGAYLSHNIRYVLLGPGSIIDPLVFLKELDQLPENVTVVVHPNAAVVNDDHLKAEEDWDSIGSTKKGAGAAAIQRMRRSTVSPNTAGKQLDYLADADSRIVINRDAYHDIIDGAKKIQIEGCQGHSLSMYNGFYPYTTSRDTSIHQLKADLAWHGRLSVATYGALRTYPIRVAGRSGPAYDDQDETTWDALGVEPEITTVTKKIRRVFTFSKLQILDSLRINSPDECYLSFCDYPGDHSEIVDFMAKYHKPLKWMSFGPDFNDMKETA